MITPLGAKRGSGTPDVEPNAPPEGRRFCFRVKVWVKEMQVGCRVFVYRQLFGSVAVLLATFCELRQPLQRALHRLLWYLRLGKNRLAVLRGQQAP
jgi:hypothetical protein